jgi:phosphohistidine phosphatase
MIVTIWRHGAAGSAVSDRRRELTGRGMDDIGYGCHQYHDICHSRSIPHPELVLHSDWVRTTQTADIVASAFTHARIRSMGALLPGSDARAVDVALSRLFQDEKALRHVVLVSHQPLVSRLVDHYLGEPGRVPSLSPGALVTLEMDVPAKACAQMLFWALPPDFETDA